MSRTIATHITMLIVGLSLGIGAVAVADRAPTAHSSAADTRIVSRLDVIDKSLQRINNSVTGYNNISGTPLRELLGKICTNTGQLEGASSIGCY